MSQTNGTMDEVSGAMVPNTTPPQRTPRAEVVRFDTVRPDHYHRHTAHEVIPVISAWKLNFNLGNVVKYVARHALKGDPAGDLKKAREYLDRELESHDSFAAAEKHIDLKAQLEQWKERYEGMQAIANSGGPAALERERAREATSWLKVLGVSVASGYYDIAKSLSDVGRKHAFEEATQALQARIIELDAKLERSEELREDERGREAKAWLELLGEKDSELADFADELTKEGRRAAVAGFVEAQTKTLEIENLRLRAQLERRPPPERSELPRGQETQMELEHKAAHQVLARRISKALEYIAALAEPYVPVVKDIKATLIGARDA